MAVPMSALLDGFLDGFTAAGMFGKLSRPGAPTEFIDSRSIDDFLASGEPATSISRISPSTVKRTDRLGQRAY